MDPWISLCEQVDTRLNRLACQAVVGTPDEALDALHGGLIDLARLMRATPWPGIGELAAALEQVASDANTPDDVSPALAHVQTIWAEYQRHLVGEVADTTVTPEEIAAAQGAEDAAEEAAEEPVLTSPAPAEILAEMLQVVSLKPIEVTHIEVPVGVTVASATEASAGDSSIDEDLEVLRSDPELSTMFISEALDHLSTIEATVLQLESDPTDQKLLNDVFRPFHTVKGNAGALNVKTVQAFAHKVENLLDLARGGSLTIGPEEIEVILESVDMLTSMIAGISSRLNGQAWEDRPQERAVLAAQIERITGAAIAHENAVAAITTVESEPLLSMSVSPVADAPIVMEMPAVEMPAMPLPSVPARAEADVFAAKPEKSEKDAASGVQQRRADDMFDTVKVDTRKLDSLVDMVGELVIIQSLIAEDPALLAADERLSRNLAQLSRIASDLQRNAMSMRMVPVRQTFQKMARLVRDLSKRSGRPVDLVLSGEDTELDRKVVEEINDPLMHMIRNSMDHGIEPPDERQRLGKTKTARLSLSASHQGGNIVIAIVDDGRGLNADKILSKAVAQGLVPAGANLQLSEIHQLIFRPGFSTADKITEISGRGVGMDVVRRNIEALRGKIDIQTEQGRGTTFSIKLPLTLAIVEGLLLRVGQERFVMPTFSIRESLRPLPERVHTVQGVPRMIQVRDTLLPLINLGRVFNIPDAVMNPCEATVVVVEDDGRYVAVLVDQLVGKQEVVIKSLGPAFAGIRGVAGGAILGDGRIGLILDAGGVIGLAEHGAAQAA
jgi:two-component system, chemotaxis family, sensor kinase CheA